MSLNRPNNRSNQGIWSGLCTPAKLYGIYSVFSVGTLLYAQHGMYAMGQLLFSIFWTFVLNWICSEGWTGLSWVLVLIPIISFVILTLMIMGAMISTELEMVVPQ
jgi:hypothetical protein